MKKYIPFYICCMAALVSSCENEEQTSLAVDYTPTPLAAAGGETSFTIHASGNWSASKTTCIGQFLKKIPYHIQFAMPDSEALTVTLNTKIWESKIRIY